MYYIQRKGGKIRLSISKQIKALLSITGIRQNELIEPLGMASKQSLYNKFTANRWTGEDLATIAELTGCKLAFILPNGDTITLEKEKGAEQ